MSEIESPCVNICVVDPVSGYCIGCGRTRDEIAGWIGMDAATRSSTMIELPDRLINMTRGRKRIGGAGSRRSRITRRH